MSSIHGLRAWAARTARHLFGFRWTTARTLTVAMSLVLWAGTASADWVVTDSGDGAGSNTDVTLRYAINQANIAGSGNITFNLPTGQNTITLSGNLPPIDANVTINGAGTPGLTINGNGHAAFFADVGTMTIENMTIANAQATGGGGGIGGAGGGGGLGAGGALFVNETATVTVVNVAFQNNSATGGTGGTANPHNIEGGGGGGGFHGAGGGGQPSGGGGGGFQGTGGNASDAGAGGGGGGGQYGNGGSYVDPQGHGINSGAGGGGTQAGQNGSPGTSTTGGAGGGTSGGTGSSVSPAAPATAGTTGGGGGGASSSGNAGGGGTFGGGGGGSWNSGSSVGNAAAGGAFGGGGGGGSGAGTGSGAAGGFGAGGGGGSDTGGANGGGARGFGGGNGGSSTGFQNGSGGNGGDGYGGAIFVRLGGTLILQNSGISGSSVTGGAGGAAGTGATPGVAGSADGAALYLMNGFAADIKVDSGTQTVSDSISGAGSVFKSGAGTLTLSGTNDYTGTTDVNQGTLNVTGSLNGSAVTVDSAGTFSVNGSVTGNVTNAGVVNGSGTINGDLDNNGKIGLANSISVLTVNGNFTQAVNTNTGEIQIGINATPQNVAPTTGVNNSFLAVNGGGTANGAVEIVGANGFYQPPTGTNAPTRYYLFGFTGAGTFNTTASLDGVDPSKVGYGINPNFVYQGVTYDALYMDILQPFVIGFSNFAAYANTPNEMAVANYIDTNSQNTNTGWQSLISTLDSLSPSGVQSALNQMSGAIYGSVAQTDFQSSTLELSFITRRLGNGLMSSDTGGLARNSYGEQVKPTALAANDSGLTVRGQNPNYWPLRRPTSGWTTWGMGYGLGGNAQGNSNAAGLNYSLGGTVVGLETADNNRIFGAYAGYVGSHLGSYLAGQSIGVNGGQSGLYLRGDDGLNYYVLLGGMGADGYNSRRLMQFGGINSTATANYGGWSSQLYFERGLTLQGYKGTLQPYAALQYLYTRQNAFTESGAGVMNLNVNGIDANSLRSLIGVRMAANSWNINGRAITPVARALWLHEFLSTNTGLNAQFAPIGGSSFAVTGTSLGRDWAILGTGLNWNLGCGWQAYANYDAQVNLVQTFHVGSGGFQYSW